MQARRCSLHSLQLPPCCACAKRGSLATTKTIVITDINARMPFLRVHLGLLSLSTWKRFSTFCQPMTSTKQST
jgi:hypothetical protein